MPEIAENLHHREIWEIGRAELTGGGARSSKKFAVQSAQVARIETKREDGRGTSQTARDLGMTLDQVSRAANNASQSPESKVEKKTSNLGTK